MIDISTKGEKSPGVVGRNYIDNSVNYYNIEKYFNYQHGLRKIFNSISTAIYHYTDAIRVGHSDLVGSYFESRYGAGQRVSVDGFLSKYVLTYRPGYHIPYTQKAGETTITPDSPSSSRISMTVLSNPTQLPIQTFPSIYTENKKKYIYFLYSPAFKDFHLETDPQKVAQVNDGKCVDIILNINNEVCPIVLVSSVDLEDKCERHVKVTGLLNKFDTKMLKLFSSLFSDVQLRIFQNAFRPYNESHQTLLLDLFSEPSLCKLTVSGGMKTLPATIYAETHFENIDKEKVHGGHIGSLLPEAYPGLHWTSMNNGERKILCGLCNSKTSIVTREYTNFAHYIDVDLASNLIFSSNLKYLKDSIEVFRKQVMRFYQRRYNIDVKNVYDFLFDYKRALYFHPKGVMSSGAFYEQVGKDAELSETMRWLKSQANTND